MMHRFWRLFGNVRCAHRWVEQLSGKEIFATSFEEKVVGTWHKERCTSCGAERTRREL